MNHKLAGKFLQVFLFIPTDGDVMLFHLVSPLTTKITQH